MSSLDSTTPGRRAAYLAIGFLVGGLSFVAWYFLSRPVQSPGTAPSPLAVEVNNRGIGHMEQFNYDDAVADFDQVVSLAPDWIAARINLGIALLNSDASGNRDRASEIFRKVLEKEPDNLYAHYCLGILDEYAGRRSEAYEHYSFVTRLDPYDQHAWYHRALMHPEASSSAEAKEFLRKAHELDPYLAGAIYALGQHGHARDPDKSEALLRESEALKKAFWDHWSRLAYTEMGKYAEVIGRHPDQKSRAPVGPLPSFEKVATQVTLPANARWAKSADFGDGPAATVRRAVRERFGGTLVLLDYNGDGLVDVFLLGAVLEGGKVRDALLRNDGGFHFTDVTAEAGLAAARPSLGCAVGDFDNDGRPDLVVTGAGEQHLFRNTGKGTFEDVSEKAGLSKIRSVCLAACWVDIDQDGDLDLLLAEVAPAPAALSPFDLGAKADFNSRVAVLLNVGQAPPAPEGSKPPPLTVAFRPAGEKEALDIHGPQKITGLLVSDLDGDGDVDVLAFAEGGGAMVALNDRLMRFHTAKFPNPSGMCNGAMVLDANHDERSDVFVLRHKASPQLLLSKVGRNHGDLPDGFADGAVSSLPLKQAVVCDLDLDGWTDVVGLSEDGVPVYLQNEGGPRLVHKQEVLGALTDWPHDLVAAAVGDMDNSCYQDLVLWSEAGGLEVRHNKGNVNRGLKLRVTGARDNADYRRTNADGVGAFVSARAGKLWTGQENTTLSAGLGQSRPVLHLGIGKADKADYVRVLWPDCVPQGELDVRTCKLREIEETYRKGISCPILFTWDGKQFVYVTDFLGAGSVGELSADGSTRAPRPEESVKIEAAQLGLLDGHYVLKVAEPMDELTYLDQLQLSVIDHPVGTAVFPDERFATDAPAPSQELLLVRDRRYPTTAHDHRGRDVSAALRERDGKTVNGFGRRSWLGFAEEHWVELAFDPAACRPAPGDRLVLCLAGWTDYPYPESIYAAAQAGVPLQFPVLECFRDGAWQRVCDAGFPAGLPRVMTRDLTGLLRDGDTRLRIRTNMRVYWDQAFLATVPTDEARLPRRANTLEVTQARLATPGFYRERRLNRDGLVDYDPNQTEPVSISRWAGNITRLGDVTELLTAADDRFAILGPGDEATVRFDARNLPALPSGWQRSFVLRSRGYCKDSAPFTATSGAIGPLPFRTMRNYPPGPEDRPPAHQGAYDRQWNTRQVRQP